MSTDPSFRDPKATAALALHRFGCGPKPGGIAAISSDPRGAILAELKPGSGLISDPGLMRSDQATRAVIAYLQERKQKQLALREQATGATAKPDEADRAVPKNAKPGTPQPKMARSVPYQIYFDEAKAHYDAALSPDVGFVQRLVWFWSNHFCIAADKGPAVRAMCGAYEREAIRPHVLGKFADMLLAVESHPAMLIYLDNARSIGPDSMAGARRGKGLNENLAREILELHTLGVRTGYTQEDVTSFAMVITGWTIVPPRESQEKGGEFTFNPQMHQPGAQTVAGKIYPDGGVEQGRAVLLDLARQPATAMHIATKLSIHFVADEPPPALVETLAQRFRDTQGDLMEVTKALVNAPEAWRTPRTKLKKPSEWILATMRACGIDIQDVRRVLLTQGLLGEPLWQPTAPKGFPDVSAPWLDGLAQRVDAANAIARRIGDNFHKPDDMIEAALGPLASAETRQTIKRAESRQQALALLLMAPEFQRR